MFPVGLYRYTGLACYGPKDRVERRLHGAMADRTLSDSETSREEFAANLRAIADAFEDGEEVDIDVENKTISLHPPRIVDQ